MFLTQLPKCVYAGFAGIRLWTRYYHVLSQLCTAPTTTKLPWSQQHEAKSLIINVRGRLFVGTKGVLSLRCFEIEVPPPNAK